MEHHSTAETVAKTNRRRVPGSTLRAARDVAKLSQEDLAGLLDVRIATVSERENAAAVAWETWLAWAFVCGVTPEWTAPTKPTKAKRKTDG